MFLLELYVRRGVFMA